MGTVNALCGGVRGITGNACLKLKHKCTVNTKKVNHVGIVV